MKLRISSLLVCLSSLAFVAVLFMNLELWAQKKFAPLPFNDAVRQQIIKEKPDAICIGNSMLGSNIVQPQFIEGMSKIFGRPAKIIFITAGGMHTAWHYLVIKNQIVASGISNIPVYIFDYEDYFARSEAKISGAGSTEGVLQKNMVDLEPEFQHVVGASSPAMKSRFPALYHQRYKIKRWLGAKFVSKMMYLTGKAPKKHKKARRKMEDQAMVQRVLSRVFRGENFKVQREDDLETSDRVAYTGESEIEFKQRLDRSFVPLITAYSDKIRPIFIQSSSNPNMPRMKESLKTYTARLGAYLTERGVQFIDMNRVHELQDSSLMRDSRHFLKGKGRMTNTQYVLREIKKHQAY